MGKEEIPINPSWEINFTQRDRHIPHNSRCSKQDVHHWENLGLSWEVEDLIAATNHDRVLTQLKSWTTKLVWLDIAGLGRELKFYYHIWLQWRVDTQGLLWYKWLTKGDNYIWKLIIPMKYQKQYCPHYMTF